MRNWIAALVAACFAFSPMLCAWAADSAAASAAFGAGNDAFQLGDYRTALTRFEAARDAGIEGPAVHYNIGVCQYKLGKYRQAEGTFRLVAERYPQMRAVAEYNLGLALLRQQRRTEARAAFEEARGDGDEKIASLAQVMLQRLQASAEPASQSSKWFSLVDARVGYDDNVTLREEASLPPDQSADSPFTEAFLMLSGPSGTGLRFDASAYLSRYSDAAEFDQNDIRLGGAYRWSWNNWRAEAGPHYTYGTLGGDGFERRVGASLRLQRPLSERASFDVRLGHDEVDALDSRFSFVEGSRDRFRLSLDRRSTRSRTLLGYELELNDRADAGVSPTRNMIWLRHHRSIESAWSLDTTLLYRSSRYGDLAATRTENLTEAALRVTRHLEQDWQLNAQYRWANNQSNVATYSYTRNRIVFGVNKAF